jgi:hypothetical protein
MSRRLLAVVAAGLVTAACQDRSDTELTSPDFTFHNTCDYSKVKNFAKSLFGNGSPGHTLAEQMSTKTPKSAAATNFGFDILAAISDKRDDGEFTATQLGNASNLTFQVIRCSDVNVTGLNTVAAFALALGPTGAFQVRGGSSTAGVADPSTPVLAFDKQAGVQAPGDNFATWLKGRALFYGFPVEPFAGELTGSEAGLSGRIAFDWSLVTTKAVTLPLATKGKFSLCVTSQDDAAFEQLRVQKVAQILEVAAAVPGLDCVAALAAAVPSSLGGRLLAIGQRLLTPQNLYAASLLRTGSPTGSAGSFSPFQVGNPLNVGLAFVNRPLNAQKNRPVPGAGGPVSVKAAGDAGTAWEGVLVRILGFTNNGTPTEVVNNEATTNAAGIASFPNLTVTKTGSIRLVAFTVAQDLDVDGFNQGQVEAPKINVRP